VAKANKIVVGDSGMDTDHTARVNAHTRTAFVKLADHVDEAEVARFGPLTALSAGIPMPLYNQILTFEAPARDDLEAAVSWMAKRDVPFWVTVPDPLLEDVGEHAVELGLAKAEVVQPMMILTSLGEIPPNETVADISEVTDADILDEVVDITATVFGIPPEFVRQMTTSSMLNDEEVRMFVGRVDGVPVACGRLIKTDDVAGVFDIAVDEEFRRQGIGEAITWAVLRAGRDAGCQIGALESTEMGYPLYQRMGFETVVDYHRFEPVT
jgi:GNAT superfamily N-acetyltransferase